MADNYIDDAPTTLTKNDLPTPNGFRGITLWEAFEPTLHTKIVLPFTPRDEVPSEIEIEIESECEDAVTFAVVHPDTALDILLPNRTLISVTPDTPPETVAALLDGFSNTVTAVNDAPRLLTVYHLGAPTRLEDLGLMNRILTNGDSKDDLTSPAVSPGSFILSLPAKRLQLTAHVRAAGLTMINAIEQKLLPITASMIRTGIGVDRPALSKVHASAKASVETLTGKLSAALGKISFKAEEEVLHVLRSRGIQVSGTSDHELSSAGGPEVSALIEYRRARQLCGICETITRTLSDDGRFHPFWEQLGSETGRYSCSEPHFLSFPKDQTLMRCIVPEAGNVFVSGDYAQADLRPIAAASKDPEILRILNSECDFHKSMAARLIGKAEVEVSPTERNISKAVTFGIIYGMGAEALANLACSQYALGWTTSAARLFINSFNETFSTFATWKSRLHNLAPREARTKLGRRRLLQQELSAYQIQQAKLVMVGQGTVADATKLAMVNLHGELPFGAKVIANLYDGILVECNEGDAGQVQDLVKAKMEGALNCMIKPIIARVTTALRSSLAG